MKAVTVIALILVIVGGLNWGLIGLFNGLNLVEDIFGGLTTIVYDLVGLAALYLVFVSGKLLRNA